MRLAVRPVVGDLGAAEVAVLVAAGIGAVGVTWFPSELSMAAGSGTEIAFAMEAVALAAALAATLAVIRRHPGRRYTALLSESLSPWAAPPLSVAVALLDILLAAVVLSASAVTMEVNFLPLTPLWAVELLILLPAAYGAGLGLEALARAFDVAFPATALLLVLTCLFAATQAESGASVVPHVPAVGGWAAVARGAYAGMWTFGGVTLLPNICAQIAPAQARRLPASVVVGAAAALLQAFGLLALDLAVMGVVGLSWYEWPTVSMLRQTRTEAFLINRVGGLDEWILVVLVSAFVALHLWNATVNLIDVLAPRARHSTRGPAMPWRNASLGGVAALSAYVVGRMLGGSSRVDRFAAGYLDPVVLGIGVGLPVALWCADVIRRRAAVRTRARA